MPGGDGTGPMGMGPMTGWGRGYCAGFTGPGFTQPAMRVGFGGGRGRGAGMGGFGRGRRFGYVMTGQPGLSRPGWPVPPNQMQDPVSERQMLQEESERLRQELESIHQRLNRLESQDGKTT